MLRIVTQWHHFYYFNYLLPEKKRLYWMNFIVLTQIDTVVLWQCPSLNTDIQLIQIMFPFVLIFAKILHFVLPWCWNTWETNINTSSSFLCHLLLFSSCSSISFSCGSCQQYSHCYQKKDSFRWLLQPNGKFQHILIIPAGHFRTLCALFVLPKRSIILPIACIACCSLYLISDNCLHRFDYVETVNPLTSKFPTDCCFKRLVFDNHVSFTSIS